MLPYLKRNKDGSASSPVEAIERKPDHEENFDVMESVAQDILNALESKDAKALAEALRAAFELMDSEPHEEGEHI